MTRFLAALSAAAFLAHPALAADYTSGSSEEGEVPVVFDAIFMRPLGIVVTGLGFGAWLLASPVMALTKPADMDKSFKSLVINPARYTWVDPVGWHPNRLDAERRGEIE